MSIGLIPVTVPEPARCRGAGQISTVADQAMTTLELDHEQQAIQPERRLVAGRYRLHARIGRGRLGDIYEADDEGFRELGVGGRVALQLLPDRIALDQGLFSKLKLGYTVLRAGSHPNIVSYLDIDHDGKFGYVVMELLDGASLRFVLDDVTTLPLEEAMPVIRAIGDALGFLHAKSIVHGQLTAENVFVTEDLEVRVLDVVPLDSASTVLRGVASRDPFSRADAGDDIYALACLAYEILAGKHPFNFHPPAEASAAGLEPARIRSLPERQWAAIRRGLSFDRDERPATIREFLGELGVTGTERLRSSEIGAPARDTAPVPAPQETPAATRPSPAARSEGGSAERPVSPVMAPTAAGDRRREIARSRRKRASLKRSVVLLPVLAGLAAWYFYGQPGDDIAELAAMTEPYLEPVADEQGVMTAAEVPAQEAVLPAEETGVEAASEPPAAEPLAPEASTPSAALPDTAADVEAGAEIVAQDGSQGGTLVQSFVTVYERDGAARIAFRRPVGTSGTLVWWSADHTALGDRDYIALEQPVAAFVAGEEAETLHIPLINDGLPEPRETFFVYLGQRNPASGALEPIARIRVDINDDD